MRSFGQQYRRAAYGRVSKPGAGKLIDGVSSFGVKVVQLVYLRPESFGYRLAKGKRK